jgi:hypothetical protein
MLRAVLVTIEPARVHTERDIRRMPQDTPDDLAGKKNVRVATHKAVAHQVLGVHQRKENVVVLPAGVVTEREVRVVALHLFNLVAANEADVRDARFLESTRRPVEQPPPLDFGVALGRVGCGRHQPPATPSSDNDGSHRLEILSGVNIP